MQKDIDARGHVEVFALVGLASAAVGSAEGVEVLEDECGRAAPEALGEVLAQLLAHELGPFACAEVGSRQVLVGLACFEMVTVEGMAL